MEPRALFNLQANLGDKLAKMAGGSGRRGKLREAGGSWGKLGQAEASWGQLGEAGARPGGVGPRGHHPPPHPLTHPRPYLIPTLGPCLATRPKPFFRGWLLTNPPSKTNQRTAGKGLKGSGAPTGSLERDEATAGALLAQVASRATRDCPIKVKLQVPAPIAEHERQVRRWRVAACSRRKRHVEPRGGKPGRPLQVTVEEESGTTRL